MFWVMNRQFVPPQHRFAYLFAVYLGLTGLTGCSIPTTERGNLPKPESLQQITPGVSDKETVARLLGTPSTTAAFDGNVWYYISRQTEQIAFLDPRVLDQQVVVVNFDDKGIVTAVDHKGLGDAQAVIPNPNATPAPGREFTFLEQLIGNFGKFNTDSSTGKKPGGGADMP
jgi:outer membrane protein assembly factor BamE (lipoprotein component of BamABCDE complex)